MPNSENSDAFKNLVAARNRLNEITKRLNEAYAERFGSADARARYLQLQAEWDAAFRVYASMADTFCVAVKELPDQLKSVRNRST